MDNLEHPYFYCYSYRLAFFIKSQGVCYIDKGTNLNSKSKYYKFQKSERLDGIIRIWNQIKQS